MRSKVLILEDYLHLCQADSARPLDARSYGVGCSSWRTIRIPGTTSLTMILKFMDLMGELQDGILVITLQDNMAVPQPL